MLGISNELMSMRSTSPVVFQFARGLVYGARCVRPSPVVTSRGRDSPARRTSSGRRASHKSDVLPNRGVRGAARVPTKREAGRARYRVIGRPEHRRSPRGGSQNSEGGNSEKGDEGGEETGEVALKKKKSFDAALHEEMVAAGLPGGLLHSMSDDVVPRGDIANFDRDDDAMSTSTALGDDPPSASSSADRPAVGNANTSDLMKHSDM